LVQRLMWNSIKAPFLVFSIQIYVMLMTSFTSLTAKLIVSAVCYDTVTSCLPRNLLPKAFNWKVEHVSRIKKEGLKLMRHHLVENVTHIRS
jgi:hypothetical protein